MKHLPTFIVAIFVCILVYVPAVTAQKSPTTSSIGLSDVYLKISKKLFEQIPLTTKIAIKPLSEKKTQLPKEILNRIIADLESSLLVASNFEARVINRARLLEIWSDATEFNSANFNKLVKKAGAEALLFLNVRGVRDGLQISVSVYATSGKRVGQVIASSGTHLAAIDWQKEAGVNVKTIDQKLATVLQEIKSISKSGGIIAKPSTYAQHYHNARIYQQRGEIDMAMSEYESVLQSEIMFVDPILDLMDLANRRYGNKGAMMYLRKKLKPTISEELYFTGLAKLSDKNTKELWEIVLKKKYKFPPFYSIWAQGAGLQAGEVSNATLHDFQKVMAAKKYVYDEHKSGRYQSYYIDQIRGAKDGNVVTHTINSFASDKREFYYPYTRARAYFSKQFFLTSKDGRTKPVIYLGWRFDGINDKVDSTKPIIVCTSETKDYPTVCHDILRLHPTLRLKPIFPSGKWFSTGGKGKLPRPKKFHACMRSVEYTDINGIKMKTPVRVTVDKRLVSSAKTKLVKECAGKWIY